MIDTKALAGVYESLRTYRGVFALLPEHAARLKASCEVMGLECPNLAAVVAPWQGREVKLWVKLNADGDLNVEELELPPWHGSFLWNEIWKVKLVDLQRPEPGVKSLAVQPQYAAREQAQAEGFDEILLVNEEGNIAEGGITNVFFIEGETLVTPDRGMLPGIARALILQAAEALDVPVILRDVKRDEWGGFDAVFVSNSIRGLVAVDEVHPLMQRLAQWCTAFIEGRCVLD